MASKSEQTHLEKLLQQMNVFTCDPERYLSEQLPLARDVKCHTKALYDTLKKHEPHNHHPEALPELIIENFDDEQIWQEIELQNTPSVTHFISNVSKILAAKDRLTFDPDDKVNIGVCENDEVSLGENDNKEDTDGSDENSESDVLELDEDLSALHPDISDDSDADLERLLDKAEANGLPADEVYSDEEDQDVVRESTGARMKMKSSVVDDQFFKLSEMEEFLTQEDVRETRRFAGNVSEDEDEEDECEDEVQGAMYADFFSGNAPNTKSSKKRVTFEEGGDEDEGKNEDQHLAAVKRKHLLDSDSEGEDVDEITCRKKTKSNFEERQEKMQKKIATLEAVSLAEKNWQMTGEVSAAVRPENSLLAEDLDFDNTSKLPPVITEESTMKLEDIVKQRIRDKAWDDVERKVKTKENPFEYKKRITLSQEKSKLSLSEVYAQEYMKQNESKDEEAEKDPKHEEIKKMMQSLFVKLDALSNFHYTPKPAIPDVKIVTNLPAITMEEVAPISVSDGQFLAPEEIKDKQRGLDVAKTERTETDRLRERRHKKAEKRKRVNDQEKRRKLVEKANPGLGNKYSKEKALKQLEKNAVSQPGVTVIKEKSTANKNVSSKKFFQQLQDEVSTHIRSKTVSKTKRKETKSTANFML